ncbi:MAG: sortase [Acidimicrobiaceae bacterium]|jgi:sortase A|nr:sortase [Acidimicrobiaceae bacterium]
MNRAALAVACLVTLAGCGSGRARVAPATPAEVTTTAPAAVDDAPAVGLSAPPPPATSTTTAAATTAPTTAPPPTPAPAPAEGDTEPLRTIGEISIVRLGIDDTLYEGVTLGTLDHGPGHWPGSAMPGENGNVVVAGHRVSHSRPFRYINLLQTGDEVVFTIDGHRSIYAVTGHEIVTPNRVDIVDPTPGATATLFACEPPGSTRYRYVVHLVLSASA